MTKSIWTYVTVVVVVGAVGGGAYLYSHRASMQVTEPTLPAQPPSTNAAPAETDDEVKRQALDGIGSIKKLKPVPIAPAQR